MQRTTDDRRTARRSRPRPAAPSPAPEDPTAAFTVPELIAQLRVDLAAGHPCDPSSLERLALGALLEGKPGTAQVLATLANGQRLDDILAELEARNG